MISTMRWPRWLVLGLALPLLIGLFMLERRLVLSAAGHQVVEVGIVLLVYALIGLWLKANSVALLKEDRSGIEFRPVDSGERLDEADQAPRIARTRWSEGMAPCEPVMHSARPGSAESMMTAVRERAEAPGPLHVRG